MTDGSVINPLPIRLERMPIFTGSVSGSSTDVAVTFHRRSLSHSLYMSGAAAFRPVVNGAPAADRDNPTIRFKLNSGGAVAYSGAWYYLA